jgi:hypothetical protein
MSCFLTSSHVFLSSGFARQGVCLGLSQIMMAARKQVLFHIWVFNKIFLVKIMQWIFVLSNETLGSEHLHGWLDRCCSRWSLEMSFVDYSLPLVLSALCDELDIVQEAAGLAFSTLFRNVGQRAIDEIVPSLMVPVCFRLIFVKLL